MGVYNKRKYTDEFVLHLHGRNSAESILSHENDETTRELEISGEECRKRKSSVKNYFEYIARGGSQLFRALVKKYFKVLCLHSERRILSCAEF